MDIKNGNLIGETPQDGIVLGKAMAIGQNPGRELIGVLPETSPRELTADETKAAIYGLGRAARQFNFVGHGPAGNAVAEKLGIESDTARNYLAGVALLGCNAVPRGELPDDARQILPSA